MCYNSEPLRGLELSFTACSFFPGVMEMLRHAPTFLPDLQWVSRVAPDNL
jgi:hypothetical protein